ncbi:MAG: UbiD family decarboxylase domain-containing protein [Isosphaeraceae bacterium]
MRSTAFDLLLKHVPAPTNTLLDAGPYFTLGIVRATDPETGKHDITIHRLSTHRRESWLDLAEAHGVG